MRGQPAVLTTDVGDMFGLDMRKTSEWGEVSNGGVCLDGRAISLGLPSPHIWSSMFRTGTSRAAVPHRNDHWGTTTGARPPAHGKQKLGTPRTGAATLATAPPLGSSADRYLASGLFNSNRYALTMAFRRSAARMLRGLTVSPVVPHRCGRLRDARSHTAGREGVRAARSQGGKGKAHRQCRSVLRWSVT